MDIGAIPVGGGIHAVEAVILLLLVMVAVFAVMARRLKVPYPIVLVLAGLAISFFPHLPRIPLDPDVVFLIFLPPLLYASAWTMSWREFRRNAVSIGLLVFGLVGFTVWGVAEFSDKFITALDWKAGFLLGAVISTTDPIAATSIATKVGLPRRIVDILEGESLLNDATGLLALEIGIAIIARGAMPTVGEGVLRLIYLVLGGLGIGLLIGVVVGWLEQFIDDGPIEVVVSLVVPYAAYLAGEKAKASGVLAVVACGIYLSRKSVSLFSPAVRLQVTGLWDAFTFILNGLVFVLIGLQVPYVLSVIHGRYSTGTLIFYGVVFSAVLIALRLVWVYPALRVAQFVERRWLGHREEPLERREVFVVGWTGMRGVIALAAAFSVPEMLANGQTFGARNLIVFLAFCVILVTLVLQGLTLPALIRALGLAGVAGTNPEEEEARRLVLESAVKHLEAGRAKDGPELAHVYDDLMHRYSHRLAAVGGGDDSADEMGGETYARLRAISAEALLAERRTLIDLRNQGKIGDDTLRKLEREIDLAATRYQGAQDR